MTAGLPLRKMNLFRPAKKEAVDISKTISKCTAFDLKHINGQTYILNGFDLRLRLSLTRKGSQKSTPVTVKGLLCVISHEVNHP